MGRLVDPKKVQIPHDRNLIGKNTLPIVTASDVACITIGKVSFKIKLANNAVAAIPDNIKSCLISLIFHHHQ